MFVKNILKIIALSLALGMAPTSSSHTVEQYSSLRTAELTALELRQLLYSTNKHIRTERIQALQQSFWDIKHYRQGLTIAFSDRPDQRYSHRDTSENTPYADEFLQSLIAATIEILNFFMARWKISLSEITTGKWESFGHAEAIPFLEDTLHDLPPTDRSDF